MCLRAQPQSLQVASLAHLYHRFCVRGTDIHAVLVPSFDAHIEYDSIRIRSSNTGLPYPTLPILVQSFIDTHNDVALCDIIDGTNVSEEWGNDNLELDGTNDIEWADAMNERLYKASGDDVTALGAAIPTQIVERRSFWQCRVRGKSDRLGWTRPDELFDTRFHMKGAPNLY